MDILLRRDFTLHKEDSRSNICLPFNTEKEYARLVCAFRYTPKEITDPELVHSMVIELSGNWLPEGLDAETAIEWEEYRTLLNFVTLSLDYGEEYIGCAHRHAPEQRISISQSGSTWGFAPHKVEQGAWRVVLNVQAVVLGEVQYHLAVCGMEEGESDDLLPSI